MTFHKMLSATCMIAGLALGTTALAKAHDNGVADGSPSGNASVGGQTAGKGGNAVSGGQKGGQRGAAASAAGSANNGGKGNSGSGGSGDGDGGRR